MLREHLMRIFRFGVVWFLILSCMGISSLFAGSTFYYTGLPFTNFMTADIPLASLPGLDSHDFVTGSATFNETAFGAQVLSDPISWWFSVGAYTWSSSTHSGSFFFSTDANGQLATWDAQVFGIGMAFPVLNVTNYPQYYADKFADISSISPGLDQTWNNTPGSWSSAAVPEPSFLLLLVLGVTIIAIAANTRIARAQIDD
jgi:hypothetical protein